MRSRALLVHAFFVGISWFAIGLPLAIVVASNPAVGDSLDDLAARAPLFLTAGLAAVVAPFALPYLWPLHMGVGAYEARLAFALQNGSQRAARTAARLLLVQAIAYALLAVALLAWFRGGGAWLVPAVMGLLHAGFARWVVR